VSLVILIIPIQEWIVAMAKSKAKPKPGKVIRVDDLTWAYLCSKKLASETIAALMRRLIGLTSRKGDTPIKAFVLPSDMYSSISEARGAAVIKAVKSKHRKPESPIAVKEIP